MYNLKNQLLGNVMQAGEFEVKLPASPLRSPHCIVSLRPWFDVGNVGSDVMKRLARLYRAEQCAALSRPSKYYDYTRYRPTQRYANGKRIVEIPNTLAFCARAPKEMQQAADIILLYVLEPNAFGEDFNDSIFELLKAFGVTRYILIGSMYDKVPHTRPLIVTGRATNWNPPTHFGNLEIKPSRHEGASTLITLLTDRLSANNIETLTLAVHLPFYLKIQHNYIGSLCLLSALSELYGLPNDYPEETTKAQQLSKRITAATGNKKQLQALIKDCESAYDKQGGTNVPQAPIFSKDIEDFLEEVSKRIDEEPQDR